MSFRTQVILSDDKGLRRRIAASAAREGIANPMQWVEDRIWRLSAQPGWDDAYASALQVGNTAAGVTESVITDGMISAAVQSLNGPKTTDEDPLG